MIPKSGHRFSEKIMPKSVLFDTPTSIDNAIR